MDGKADKLIFHCDLNNFYASVECKANPALAGVPVAVAGSSDNRHGVVLAKNELAKKKGIRTGDVVWEAKRKEPNLVIVPPNFALYSEYSKKVFNLYTAYTPLVEPFGPDECWLDVTGCPGAQNAESLADTIRGRVKSEFGLTVSVGVSFNKTFAKIASDLKKPDGTTVADRASYTRVIWNLPVSDMFMVGKKTAEKLTRLGVRTIGELARYDENTLESLLGVNGVKLRRNARGEDVEPVRSYVESRENKSVGHGMTSVRDIETYDELNAMIQYLSEKIAGRLRKYGLEGSGVAID
jgi:DNA polymerase-4